MRPYLVARRRDPALSKALDDVFHHERGYYTAALKAACADLPGEFDDVLLADSLIGAIMFRVAMRGAKLAPSELEILVDGAIALARSQAVTRR